MFVGIAINLTGRLLASASPAALFANGEVGVWYDPSDISTLFQDSAGTTPVTAPNQPVGLMLDKSQGLVLGPELVTNGDFSQGSTGWTAQAGWTIGGGVASVDSSIAGTTNISSTSVTVTAGKTYKITYTINSVSGSGIRAAIGGAVEANYRSVAGTYTVFLTATNTSSFSMTAASTNTIGTIDNISVKLLAGNHATQATSTRRPIYGINPITGTRNLLTYTEQFDNAAWTKSFYGSASAPTISANVATAPDGTQTADRISFSVSGTTSSDQSVIDSAYQTIANGQTCTYSIWLKATDAGNVGRIVKLYVGGFSSGTFIQSVTLSASWQRITGTAVSGATVGNLGIRAQGDLSQVVAVDAWGAQLELGSTATAYQKVVSQYEVTQAGVQSVSYLAFDGVDDGMVTPTITPNTDKVQVFAGVRKLSDAAQGMLVELSASLGSNIGAFALSAPVSASNNYRMQSKGTIAVLAETGSEYLSPITNVITGLGDIAGDTATLRVNGIQAANATGDQGTGNYLAYPLYIGRRGGTLIPYNGRLYSLITRFGANLTTGQITATESWVNGKTGAY